jgi:hypothetical protein
MMMMRMMMMMMLPCVHARVSVNAHCVFLYSGRRYRDCSSNASEDDHYHHQQYTLS